MDVKINHTIVDTNLKIPPVRSRETTKLSKLNGNDITVGHRSKTNQQVPFFPTDGMRIVYDVLLFYQNTPVRDCEIIERWNHGF